VEANQIHPQHIHGFPNGTNATIPTLTQDDDRDGFIELAEGAETYGPVLLSLTSPPGPAPTGFPKPGGTTFVFAQTYDLNDPRINNAAESQFGQTLDDVSLAQRHIVLHGLSTLAGHGSARIGQAADGEVNGEAGYKIVLPIAAGQIQELSFNKALDRFESALTVNIGRTIEGTARGDRLAGGGFGETLLGLSGNDVINGGRGDDYLNGGGGRDRLSGQSGDDYLEGGSGSDRLFGSSGQDYLIGGSGHDELSGAGGHDHLDGGSGRDSLDGGGSNDFLAGGGGDDAFVFSARLNGASNVDTVSDFGNGNDSFQLDNAVFVGLATGALSAEAFALLSATAEADDRIVYDPNTGNLFFDANGGTRIDAVLFAKLTNAAALSAGDFAVV
jgi:Ca2+-binding RTX toxin-like protein